MAAAARKVGEFCWINLLTPDPLHDREFYSKLLRWSFAEIPGMGYLILVDGKQAGGMFPNTVPNGPTSPPGIGVMVRVESADAIAAKAAELGGRSKPAFDIGPRGRMAEVVDPTGAQLDLWQPRVPDAVADCDGATHGAPSWFELITPDAPKARQFYCDLFGWTAEDMVMPTFTYTVFTQGDTRIGGLMGRTPDMPPFPPFWGTYITVDDVDATVADAPNFGGSVCMPAQDIPGVGRFAGILSPAGVMFYAITYAR
jgi:predicted enzyme related to lactoylglutathione lyase